MAKPQSDFNFQARIIDQAGNVVAMVDDPVHLNYTLKVNAPGLAMMCVPEGHRLLSLLEDDLMIEIYIGYPSSTSAQYTHVKDFTGLYRDKQVSTDAYGIVYYILNFVGAIEALARQIIAYAAGTNLRSKWSNKTVDEIMAQAIQYNCAVESTTAYGRLRTVNRVRRLHSPLVLFATPAIYYAAAYRNVLEVVQELGKAYSVDFDVFQHASASFPGDLDCKLYLNQLGTDKTATVIFDLNLHNLGTASLEYRRLQEKTVAIVGGKGDGASRPLAVRTGANYTATNDYEIFVDARSNASEELSDAGDTKLAELQATAKVDGELLQSEGYIYKRDYGLGDLVTVSFAGITAQKKIMEIQVSFAESGETDIRIGFDEV